MKKFTTINENDPKLIGFIDELPLWSAPFALKILDKVIPAKNLTVLDIGCGTGVPLIELASRLGDSCTVYGIDPWKEAIERIKIKTNNFGINNIILFNSHAEKIPLTDNSINLIISNNGLNNVQDLGQVLSECHRILKPGGKLIFTMNTEETMCEFYDVFETVLSEMGLTKLISEMYRHIHQKRKPLDEVYQLIEKSGFRHLSTDRDIFYYSFTDGSAMFSHFFIRLAFLGPWLEIVPEDKRRVVFNEIERRINKIAKKEGNFRLSIPFAVIETEAR